MEQNTDGCKTLRLRDLDIDNSAELLDSVEKEIPLFDTVLVLGVLDVGPVGDHYASHFVDLSVQPSAGNKSEIGQTDFIKPNFFNLNTEHRMS